MKTIFDKITKDELIFRINSLDEKCNAQWGTMDAYQMVKHCRLWEEMMQSEVNLKRVFIGRIFGRLALKIVLGNENPLKRNTPTVPSLIIKETKGNFEVEKALWIATIEKYSNFNNQNFQHVFFWETNKGTNRANGL